MRSPYTSETSVETSVLQDPQEVFVDQLRTIEAHVEEIVTPGNPDVTWTQDERTRWVTGTGRTHYPIETGNTEELAISQRLGPRILDRPGGVGYTLATPNETLSWRQGETNPNEVIYHVVDRLGQLKRETRVPHFAVERFFGKVATSEAVQRDADE